MPPLDCEVTQSPKTVKPVCHRPWTGFELVDHLGDVRPCCWGKKSCGNVNEQSADEIWNGPGFQLYRDRMMEGKVEDICNPWCPILQGNYVEESRWGGLEGLQSSITGFDPSESLPEYLRVVPTTACNLKCPMCYQAGDPPTKLPETLFAQLERWIRNAKELLVMGGETFIAKQCLQWIRLVDPQRYPSCGLAAITNGLGFTDEICHLISARRWNWILVSIDAATVPVFAKVRGGDFTEVLHGLERLTEVRAKCARPFEIRLGFTLQNSNLCDAISFVDLCDRYNAMPQFTMVFGDWHNEFPENRKQIQKFLSTIERLDKKLWERGFGNQIVASALAALHARELLKSRTVASALVPLSKVVSSLRGELHRAEHVSYGEGRDAFRDPRASTSDSTRITDGGHRQFELSSGNLSPDFWRELAKETLDTYSVAIPFFARDDIPLSALKVYPAVKKLRKIAFAKGWRLRQAVDFTEFGLHPDDCRLEFDTILDKGEKGLSSLSVVSPIFNREVELPSFLNSVMNQEFDERFELILVDDKSTDRSIRASLRTLSDFPARIHVRLLRTKRKNRYEKGTFSFGAGLAREIAVRQSEGKRILFLDPDQIVEQGCFKEHATWGGRGFDVVIGDRLETDGDVSSQWQFLRTESLTAVADWWLSFFTGNSSVDRELLLRVGGFDPRLQYWGLDDTDLGYRLWKEGASVWHTRRARVIHIDPLGSGGGTNSVERTNSYRLHMEVLYRKYLEEEILSAFSFVWADRVRSKSELT